MTSASSETTLTTSRKCYKTSSISRTIIPQYSSKNSSGKYSKLTHKIPSTRLPSRTSSTSSCKFSPSAKSTSIQGHKFTNSSSTTWHKSSKSHLSPTSSHRTLELTYASSSSTRAKEKHSHNHKKWLFSCAYQNSPKDYHTSTTYKTFRNCCTTASTSSQLLYRKTRQKSGRKWCYKCTVKWLNYRRGTGRWGNCWEQRLMNRVCLGWITYFWVIKFSCGGKIGKRRILIWREWKVKNLIVIMCLDWW